MSKKTHNTPRQTNSANNKNTIQPKNKSVVSSRYLFDSIESLLDKHGNKFFWIIFSLGALFALLMFDFKPSTGGDDSNYIIRAYDLVKQGRYPSFQGPLYPIFLSPFVAVLGVELTFLKFTSYLLLLGSMFLYYKSLRGFVPNFVTYSTLLLAVINGHLLYYASQTYSEAFFMMLQACFFYVFTKWFATGEESTWRDGWRKMLLLGTLVLLLGLTRSAGFVAIGALVVVFVVARQWRYAIGTFVSFVGVMAVFETLKRLIWGKVSQFSDQMNILLLVDPYDVSKGQEDFSGFITRFIDNSNLYLSKHLFRMLGLKPEVTVISPVVTIIVYALAIVFLIWALRRNKVVLLNGLYAAALCILTFVMLQKRWDSLRLIAPFFLPMMVLLLWGFHETGKLVQKNQFWTSWTLILFGILFAGYECLSPMEEGSNRVIGWIILASGAVGGGLYLLRNATMQQTEPTLAPFRRFYQWSLVVIVLLLSIAVFRQTSERMGKQNPAIKAYLGGDEMYGYTPDWINYLQMCQWAAQNVPDSIAIACRKPEVAFFYAKRRLYGLYSLPTQHIDSLKQQLQQTNKPYIIVESDEWEKRKTPEQLRAVWLPHNVAQLTINFPGTTGTGNDDQMAVYEIYQQPDTDKELFMNMLDTFKVQYTTNLEVLIEQAQKQGTDMGRKTEYTVINPDILLKRLTDNKVGYVIMASLRKYEAMKTEYTINTEKRYLYYILQKYPGKLEQVHVIGNDEQAYLWRIKP